MLRVEDLTVRFGGHAALAGMDLDVRDGQVVCVLGPSGSGKTTLLRAIAGLEVPDTGRITWDGRDLAGVPPHRRGFGLMFQDYVLLPHRDVFGNVALGPRLQGLSPGRVRDRVREVLGLVGLEGYEPRAVGNLSGGEQQRVALARALAPAPSLLMLDEPIGALDRTLRERLMVELRSLFTELGITALYVTHDQEEAFAVADHLVVMRAGRVEQEGPPGTVWRWPQSEFVARFLGFHNIVDAEIADRWAITPWGKLPVAGNAPRGAARLVVRPEAFTPVDDGPVEGVVESRTFRGDHFLLRVRPTEGPTFEVAARWDVIPEPGDWVRLAVDPDQQVVLSPISPGVLRE
ncbi:MAG: ABC transporter ATP-binding protein [Acidimicrobiia bacterium]